MKLCHPNLEQVYVYSAGPGFPLELSSSHARTSPGIGGSWKAYTSMANDRSASEHRSPQFLSHAPRPWLPRQLPRHVSVTVAQRYLPQKIPCRPCEGGNKRLLARLLAGSRGFTVGNVLNAWTSTDVAEHALETFPVIMLIDFPAMTPDVKYTIRPCNAVADHL